MADLKTAAAKRSGKTTSKLGSAAKARAKSKSSAQDDGISVEDPIVPPEQYKPTPNIISGQTYNQPPPLPPELQYLRMFATIPALRKKTGGPVMA